MTAEQFKAAARKFFAGWHYSIVVTPANPKNRPAGIICARQEGRRLFPHAFWFKWATPRQKMEGVWAFLGLFSKSHLCVIASTPRNAPFFTRLTKYGLLRPVGTVDDWYWNGLDERTGAETAHLFQTMAT